MGCAIRFIIKIVSLLSTLHENAYIFFSPALEGVIFCQVGLELVPRDYDMDGTSPFRKSDIISMVPVYKVTYITNLI